MSDGNDTTQIKNIKWSIGGKQVSYSFDPKIDFDPNSDSKLGHPVAV